MPRRSRSQSVDWVGLAQVVLVLSVCGGLYMLFRGRQADNQEWSEVKNWLKHQRLTELEPVFKEKGVTSLQNILDLSSSTIFSEFPRDIQLVVSETCRTYRDSISLQLWVTHHGLEHYLHSLEKHGVHKLTQLVDISELTLQKVTASDYTLRDYGAFTHAVAELRAYTPTYHQLKAYKPNSVFFKHFWTFGGFVLFSLLVGMLVLAVNMNYVGYASSYTSASHPKHSILEFVTGKYLAVQCCKVHWEWEEPQTVGKTLSFTIKFFQRNGRPYAISPRDGLVVEILLGASKVTPDVQLGTDANSNSARVTFTVHRSGEYRISVMVAAKHIRGSPFCKRFSPGEIDPGRTGFVSHTSIVVCTRGMKHSLQVEPRDEYGNMCTATGATTATTETHYQIAVTESSSKFSYKPTLSVKHDKSSKRVLLELRMEKEGCYQAVATYRGVKLKNPDFTILVLNDTETAAVNKSLAKKSHNVFYEARLLPSPDKVTTSPEKAKKVFCYISPKQLTIKEFCLKIFPIRLFTFRVCPSTKFQFLGLHNQYETPVLLIDDGCQPPVKLATKDRNIIAATFTNFLLKNIGGSETFKDKQDFFSQEVRSYHAKRPHDKITLKIHRATLLDSSFKATKNFSISEWCKNFEIVFQGEEGLDWGGLRREWFEIVCRELFDPNGSGLFCRFKDDPQALVLPNNKRPAHMKTKWFEFAGRIVGKCLYESALGGTYRQMVKARFTRSFLAQLIGLRVTYRYFEQDDPELYMSKIRYIEENSVEDMGLVFAEEEYLDGKLAKVVDLIPNGSRVDVTDGNKLGYLDALAQYKLSRSVREETEAFLKGLNDLIPDNLLSIFDENELELLLCGTGNYSITEFKEHHSLCGATADFHKVLDWFWVIVAGLTQEEMARLLQFTTGCSQLPPGGFSELNPKVQLTYAPTYGNLPTAHTCFNQLCLPDYESMESMHQALLLAINEGNQGFGML